MSTLTLLVILMVAVFLPGIATAESELSLLPEGWGRQNENRVAQSECPVVEGRYLSENPEVIVKTTNKSFDPARSARVLFRHPRTDKSSWIISRLEKPISKEHLYLDIRQLSPDKFELTRSLESGDRERTEIFDSTLGDFECKAGFIRIRPYVLDQTGLFHKSSEWLTLTENGMLLLYKKIENARSEMIFLRSSNVSHSWYRFAPVHRN